MENPSAMNVYLADHAALMLRSFHRLLGRGLLPTAYSPEEQARQLYFAPFVVVSHDTAEDPIFNYANERALALFEMTWQEFTRLPSRCSAEPMNREARAHLLEKVSQQGFIDNYAGIRISKSGRRFTIERATVWNLVDEVGNYRGQAATFSLWRFI